MKIRVFNLFVKIESLLNGKNGANDLFCEAENMRGS